MVILLLLYSISSRNQLFKIGNAIKALSYSLRTYRNISRLYVNWLILVYIRTTSYLAQAHCDCAYPSSKNHPNKETYHVFTFLLSFWQLFLISFILQLICEQKIYPDSVSAHTHFLHLYSGFSSAVLIFVTNLSQLNSFCNISHSLCL